MVIYNPIQLKHFNYDISYNRLLYQHYCIDPNLNASSIIGASWWASYVKTVLCSITKPLLAHINYVYYKNPKQF